MLIAGTRESWRALSNPVSMEILKKKDEIPVGVPTPSTDKQ